ncbi:hypothetical protein Peur_021684 [Populus x canadensis]
MNDSQLPVATKEANDSNLPDAIEEAKDSQLPVDNCDQPNAKAAIEDVPATLETVEDVAKQGDKSVGA